MAQLAAAGKEVPAILATANGRPFYSVEGGKQSFLSFKLAHADVLLKTQSEMTIKQIAEAVGYDDPLYFSRLYKKYRGITPSAIRTEEAPIL